MSLSLSELYDRVLKTATKASNLSTLNDETQDLILECLGDLKTLHARIVEFSVFSPNETLEDISTTDLIYLSVPYVLSEVHSRLRTTKRSESLQNLAQIETYIQSFIGILEKYLIVPAEEQKLYSKNAANVSDAAKKRQLKIDQFKREKDLKGRLEKLQRQRVTKAPLDELLTNYDLIASMLPPSPNSKDVEKELDSDTDEILRETILLLLRLLYAQASSHLQSLEQEVELLKNAPPSPVSLPKEIPEDARERRKKEEDNQWKLDIPNPGGPDGKGPLMDASGKPLRPFTILPSDAGERARLQAKVFGPGHNLPTMSVDEYLEIERQRGKFISGGGPGSENVPTSSEQLAIDAEMDGTLEGELKLEEKRQKDEKWARYTDENPRGIGNTMNRG